LGFEITNVLFNSIVLDSSPVSSATTISRRKYSRSPSSVVSSATTIPERRYSRSPSSAVSSLVSSPTTIPEKRYSILNNIKNKPFLIKVSKAI
jgi:hypothetical protein